MPPPRPPLPEALRYWFRLGFVNFGGPAGQIAMMHRDLVDERKWIEEDRFLHALNFCMLLPGPEAQQLAIYIGWLLNGIRGGVAAGVFFVLPAVFLLLAMSWAYAALGHLPSLAGPLWGLKCAVVAIVAEALVRVGRRALKSRGAVVIAAAAFVALRFAGVPFPLVILGAAAAGFLRHRLAGADRPGLPAGPNVTDGLGREQAAAALRAALICAVLWIVPVGLVALLFGPSSTLAKTGLFFSGAAMVTFGGAYAVLSYVAQHAVEDLHWLSAAQMVDGLGLAETTPGPLIMVLQFTGFMAGWNHPGNLPPWLAGTAGALLTSWVTFTPCFLWIFLGAPWIERLRGNASLSASLAAITAAVTGVIANLALFFALSVLLPGGGMDWAACALAALCLLVLTRTKIPMPAVIAAAALAGGLIRMAAGA